MNTLTVVAFACVVVLASAAPSGLHGLGYAAHHAHGLAIVHGHDDGQWHGEGLLASQDWAGHHGAAIIAAPHSAAIIAPAVHGVAVGHGIGLGHGVAVGHGVGYGHGVAVGHAAIVADGIHAHHGLAHHGLAHHALAHNIW